MIIQTMDDFEVGDGASTYINGDMYPATVIAKKGKRITVQYDIYKCVKPSSVYGADDAVYEYTRNPDGPTRVFSLRKNGRFRQLGDSIWSGYGLTQGRYYKQNPHI